MRNTEFTTFEYSHAVPDKSPRDGENGDQFYNQSSHGKGCCIHRTGLQPTRTNALETAVYSSGALLKQISKALITLAVTGRLYPATLPT